MLKPSDLIRKGAAKIEAAGHRQLFGNLANGEGDACALGAMYVGFGIPAEELTTSPLRAGATNLIFGDDQPNLKVLFDGSQPIESAIVTMNDVRKWNFAAIADYLESVGF